MRIRLHLLPETDSNGNPHSCSHIRLLRPLSHPSIADSFIISQGRDIPPGHIDAVIVERCWRADASAVSAEELVAAVRARGAALIYTLDDNLLDHQRIYFGSESHPVITRSIVAFFLRQSNGVIVSTDMLKKRLLSLSGNIVVVNTALDERLFLGNDEPAGSGRCSDSHALVIGYMGTHTHMRDLMMVLEPLRSVCRRSSIPIEFQVVGIVNDKSSLNNLGGLSCRVLDPGSNHPYPQFVRWARNNLRWDLAIAPLEDNAFTRCKSDIKYLDYSLLGIPGIYSDVEAFRHSVRAGITGWICENTTNSWKAALVEAVENHEFRRGISQAAFHDVCAGRLLEQCAVNWKHAIIGLLNSVR